jgi:hypothetical protein
METTTTPIRGRPVMARGLLQPLGVAGSVVRRRPRVGGREVLSRRLARELERNVGAEERVDLCVRGESGHAIACLADRLLLLKAGFFAGTTFGSTATTIYYKDVTGIQIHVKLLSGWIEISSPSFQGRERKHTRPSRLNDRDVYKLPNCFPIQKRHRAAYTLVLAELRARVAATKESSHRMSSLSEIERLAALHREGLLDESEFALVKERVLRDAGSHLSSRAI